MKYIEVIINPAVTEQTKKVQILSGDKNLVESTTSAITYNKILWWCVLIGMLVLVFCAFRYTPLAQWIAAAWSNSSFDICDSMGRRFNPNCGDNNPEGALLILLLLVSSFLSVFLFFGALAKTSDTIRILKDLKRDTLVGYVWDGKTEYKINDRSQPTEKKI